MQPKNDMWALATQKVSRRNIRCCHLIRQEMRDSGEKDFYFRDRHPFAMHTQIYKSSDGFNNVISCIERCGNKNKGKIIN